MKCFSSDELKNYLVFISTRHIYWNIKDDSDRKIKLWGSTGISQEII